MQAAFEGRHSPKLRTQTRSDGQSAAEVQVTVTSLEIAVLGTQSANAVARRISQQRADRRGPSIANDLMFPPGRGSARLGRNARCVDHISEGKYAPCARCEGTRACGRPRPRTFP